MSATPTIGHHHINLDHRPTLFLPGPPVVFLVPSQPILTSLSSSHSFCFFLGSSRISLGFFCLVRPLGHLTCTCHIIPRLILLSLTSATFSGSRLRSQAWSGVELLRDQETSFARFNRHRLCYLCAALADLQYTLLTLFSCRLRSLTVLSSPLVFPSVSFLTVSCSIALPLPTVACQGADNLRDNLQRLAPLPCS